jgi:5'-nucleotidase
LLTNDDGIDAPGMAALVEAASQFGELVVVAPNVELSGCSHRVTVDRPLEVQEIAPRRYRVDGTPADCIRVALGHLKLNVDCALAGINPGGNLGADVWMSGTVAAAREAALWGLPGMAISQYRRSREPVNWPRSTRWARAVLEQLSTVELKGGQFWNVNLPDPPATSDPDERMPLVEFSPLDANRLDVRYEAAQGRILYRGRYQDRPHSSGSDVQRCFAGAITATRLTVRA